MLVFGNGERQSKLYSQHLQGFGLNVTRARRSIVFCWRWTETNLSSDRRCPDYVKFGQRVSYYVVVGQKVPSLSED